MGRCLAANLLVGGGSAATSLATGSVGGLAVVEGVMDDGSVCALSVGECGGRIRSRWR